MAEILVLIGSIIALMSLIKINNSELFKGLFKFFIFSIKSFLFEEYSSKIEDS
jgi:hypothetical protein